MTTPTVPDVPGPDELGPCAGPPDSELNQVWRAKLAQVLDAQETNSRVIHGMASQGINGADVMALMTRVNTLIDHLFGTNDGHPGMIQDNQNPHHRLTLELEIQQRTAHTLAQIEQMVVAQRVAAGQAHQTQSGLFVAGKNGQIKP